MEVSPTFLRCFRFASQSGNISDKSAAPPTDFYSVPSSPCISPVALFQNAATSPLSVFEKLDFASPVSFESFDDPTYSTNLASVICTSSDELTQLYLALQKQLVRTDRAAEASSTLLQWESGQDKLEKSQVTAVGKLYKATTAAPFVAAGVFATPPYSPSIPTSISSQLALEDPSIHSVAQPLLPSEHFPEHQTHLMHHRMHQDALVSSSTLLPSAGCPAACKGGGLHPMWACNHFGFSVRMYRWYLYEVMSSVLKKTLKNVFYAHEIMDLSRIRFEAASIKYALLPLAAFRLAALADILQAKCEELLDSCDYPEDGLVIGEGGNETNNISAPHFSPTKQNVELFKFNEAVEKAYYNFVKESFVVLSQGASIALEIPSSEAVMSDFWNDLIEPHAQQNVSKKSQKSNFLSFSSFKNLFSKSHKSSTDDVKKLPKILGFYRYVSEHFKSIVGNSVPNRTGRCNTHFATASPALSHKIRTRNDPTIQKDSALSTTTKLDDAVTSSHTVWTPKPASPSIRSSVVPVWLRGTFSWKVESKEPAANTIDVSSHDPEMRHVTYSTQLFTTNRASYNRWFWNFLYYSFWISFALSAWFLPFLVIPTFLFMFSCWYILRLILSEISQLYHQWMFLSDFLNNCMDYLKKLFSFYGTEVQEQGPISSAASTLTAPQRHLNASATSKSFSASVALRAYNYISNSIKKILPTRLESVSIFQRGCIAKQTHEKEAIPSLHVTIRKSSVTEQGAKPSGNASAAFLQNSSELPRDKANDYATKSSQSAQLLAMKRSKAFVNLQSFDIKTRKRSVSSEHC